MIDMTSKYLYTNVMTLSDVKPCSVCGSLPILVVNHFRDRLGAYVHCPNDCHVTPMRHARRVMGKNNAINLLKREAMDDWNGRRYL